MDTIYVKCCPKCGFIGLGVFSNCRYCETPYIVTEHDLCENSDDNGNLKPEIRKAIFEKYIKDNPMYSEVAAKQREEKEYRNMLNLPSSYKPKESMFPKCPTCGSTNVQPISTTKKATGFILAGIFSSNFGKSYECKDCKYKW